MPVIFYKDTMIMRNLDQNNPFSFKLQIASCENEFARFPDYNESKRIKYFQPVGDVTLIQVFGLIWKILDYRVSESET